MQSGSMKEKEFRKLDVTIPTKLKRNATVSILIILVIVFACFALLTGVVKVESGRLANSVFFSILAIGVVLVAMFSRFLDILAIWLMRISFSAEGKILLKPCFGIFSSGTIPSFEWEGKIGDILGVDVVVEQEHDSLSGTMIGGMAALLPSPKSILVQMKDGSDVRVAVIHNEKAAFEIVDELLAAFDRLKSS